jgi:LDH2 family malate/lactate/ureidoglycolate dehydrogenase
MVLVSVKECTDAALSVLAAAGVPSEHARIQVELLIDAELRGVPSHGMLRFERIFNRIANGFADAQTQGVHIWRGDAFLSVDGQNGLGPVVAQHAVAAIAERARTTGIAVAAISASNHIGMLAWYAEAIAEAGQVSIILTTSEALVHPYGGRIALLGTNPIAIGVPTDTGPFVIDLATSLVSMGEVHDHANRGAALQPGWAVDADGNPTTDANAAKSGAIAPFGGAKGYALGLAFELLVTALTGAALGRDVTGTLNASKLCNKGDVFIVIDPLSGQGAALSAYLEVLRNTPPAEGFEKVLIPGERGRALKAERQQVGLTLADAVWDTVRRLRDQAEAR